MWERLRQADITLAKQQLRRRVDETLLRHAQELKGLDSEQAEIDALNRLLDEFSRKFKPGPGATAAPAKAEPASEATAVQPASDHTPAARSTDKRTRRG